ncbi:serine-rich adhesin for platelets-like isoform X2 [Neocloeon triangulifer]|uniref:serine-rich adhesin for platelets-like isoform X2 n=1 Tax=Neocloeon triangulifer TaxID=2078957 RepID=UPI00286F685D|nr:serine-rich adhesin for platelets-like isoform X2 [Neocloeon triangulifer]
MAKASGESRIPVLRSSGLRPAMLPGQWPSGGGRRPLDSECVGQRVCVGGEVVGVLRFFGGTAFDTSGSTWCGVELDTPDGLNDGCVHGVRYFSCKPKHGILAPESKVQLASEAAGQQKASKKRLSTDSLKQPNQQGYSSSSESSTSPSGCSQEEATPPIHLMPKDRHGQSSVTTTSPIPCTSSSWKSKDTCRQNSDEATPPKVACTSMAPAHETAISPTDSESRGSLACSSGSLMLPLNCSPPSFVHGLSKCNSYDFDDSLGILTPDQMNSDFTATCPGSDEDELEEAAKHGGILLLESPPPKALEFMEPIAEKEPLSTSEPKDPGAVSAENSTSDFVSKGDESMSQSQCTISATCPVPNPGCSFVTSISSITSLDNGYQGDGELSRPTSVAETSSSMAAPAAPPPGQQAIDVHKIKFDTMTDSDFFSDPGAMGPESDNEAEAGMAIGDRKARVIDGTLYSTSPANSVAQPPAPHLMTSSAATIEDMESSGVFSDAEPPKRPEPLSAAEPCIEELPGEVEMVVEEEEKNDLPEKVEVSEETPKVSNETGTPGNKAQAKKMKMPNRNVTSKVKSLISNSAPVAESIENQENRRQMKSKGLGKWDAVMNKIAKSQAEEKAKPKVKEVKSRVFANLSLQPSSQIDAKTNNNNNNNRGASPFRTGGNVPSRPNSARARRENLSTPKPNKAKRSKLRGAESSSSLQAVVKDDAKIGSSINSSLSDVSRASNLYKIATDQGPNNSTKKGAAKAKPTTNNARNLKQTPTKPKLTPSKDQNRNVHPLSKEPSTPAKKVAPAPPPVIVPPPPHLLHELSHASAGCEAMAVLVQYLVHSVGAFSVTSLKAELGRLKKEWALTKSDLAESKVTIERLQQSLSDEVRAHEMHLETREAEFQERLAQIEANHQKALAAATSQYEQKVKEIETLRLEAAENLKQTEHDWLSERNQMVADVRAEAEKRLQEGMEREADLNQQVVKMTAQLADSTRDSRMFLELMHKDKDTLMQASADRCLTLEKEVDSLRVVLDMRHAELQSLRKVAAEASEKADLLMASEIQLASLKSKVEDLQSQLHSKSTIEMSLKEENKSLAKSYYVELQNNRRLSQLQEELQWRIKQSSEVISRLSSSCGGSPSMSASFKNCASPVPSGFSDDSSDSCRTSHGLEDSPRIKIMARKSDSVAYLLDMSADYLEYKMSRSQNESPRPSCSINYPTKKSASSSGIPSRKPVARKGVTAATTSTPRKPARNRSRSASSDSESFEVSDEEQLRQAGQKVDRTSSSTMSASFEFSFSLQPQEAAGEAMVSEDDGRNQIAGSSSVSSSENITIGDLEEELSAKRLLEEVQDSFGEESGWMEEMKSGEKS